MQVSVKGRLESTMLSIIWELSQARALFWNNSKARANCHRQAVNWLNAEEAIGMRMRTVTFWPSVVAARMKSWEGQVYLLACIGCQFDHNYVLLNFLWRVLTICWCGGNNTGHKTIIAIVTSRQATIVHCTCTKLYLPRWRRKGINYEQNTWLQIWPVWYSFIPPVQWLDFFSLPCGESLHGNEAGCSV